MRNQETLIIAVLSALFLAPIIWIIAEAAVYAADSGIFGIITIYLISVIISYLYSNNK